MTKIDPEVGDAGPDELPGLLAPFLEVPDEDAVERRAKISGHPPRVLLLCGSLRTQSFSRLVTLEAARLLTRLGAEPKIFDAAGLPMPDSAPPEHPKVLELRALSLWSEAHFWCSAEYHGTMTGVLKCQLDWIPLEYDGKKPTEGRTLAVVQVCGGTQSFNAINALRVCGRWLRMLTIPNQSSIPYIHREFDEAGRMKPSPYYDRLVDVMEELVKFTLLTRDRAAYLTSRYSDRKKQAEPTP